jgi:putative flippase GtrA
MIRARELGIFTLVGTTATAVNLAIVSFAVPLGVPPLAANIVGFLLAFAWSFFGHSRWTFPADGRDVVVVLQRFAIISVLSFTLTEVVYAGVLEWTTVDYRLSLFLVILAVAVGKLLASKHWAFARS